LSNGQRDSITSSEQIDFGFTALTKEQTNLTEKRKNEEENVKNDNDKNKQNEHEIQENIEAVVEIKELRSIEINKYNKYKIYELISIIEIFKKKENLKQYIKFILKIEVSEKIKNQIYDIHKKRIRRKAVEVKKAKKEGETSTKGPHDKYSPDNIVSKIRSYLFRNLVYSVNEILKEYKVGFNLKKLNPKKMNGLKKDDNLKDLDMNLEEFLSREISPKNKSDKDINKTNIVKLLNRENQTNIEKIKSLFKLTFREWMNYFLMKENNAAFKFDGLDMLLKTILEINENLEINEKDKQYFVDFVFILYNYERWFHVKKARTAKDKKK
jgi:hypothetical protein